MKRWSLLAVTDLHYALPQANYLDDPKELDPSLWAFRDDVFADFRSILEGLGDRSADLVAVAGDITTHGQRAGIQRFVSEALPELQRIARQSEAVCVVPGNHDVEWGLGPTQPGALRRKFDVFWDDLAFAHPITSCLYPTGELKPNSDNLSLRNTGRGPIYVDEDRKLVAVCLNSAIRCGERDEQMDRQVATPLKEVSGQLASSPNLQKAVDAVREKLDRYLIRDIGHVTRAQRARVIKELERVRTNLKDDWASYLRVGMLHHHLMRFPGQAVEHKGSELLVDSSDVLTFFNDFNFDLVITGHKHQEYSEVYTSAGRQMLLVGGPTVGGYTSGNSFRGLRWIDIEESSDSRRFSITDIPTSVGQANASAALAERRRKPTHVFELSRGLGTE